MSTPIQLTGGVIPYKLDTLAASQRTLEQARHDIAETWTVHREYKRWFTTLGEINVQ